MDETSVLSAAGIVVLVVGVRLLWLRWRRVPVEVLSRDELVLTSERLGLRGRPDRLVRLRNGQVIPEEKKSGAAVQSHWLPQIGTYLLLVEETYGRRPPYGVIILRDQSRHRVPNTAALRRQTLRLAAALRRQQRDLHRPAATRVTAAQCRQCGFREGCDQRRG